MSAERIVVVGFGWVGQANALALKMQGCDVSYFDPASPERHYKEYENVYKEIPRLEKVADADTSDTWYVVCVGDRVAEDGTQDLTSIRKALDSLKGLQGGVILRSTIIPAHLQDLVFDHYVPEFLHEIKAVEECLDPYLFVVGSRAGSAEPDFFSIWRARAYKVFEGAPEEASFIKYLSNLWGSVRIAFVNEFGDALGVPRDKEGLERIERIINFLFDGRSYMRYGKAFGGHCLPKDTRAFVGMYGKSGELPLLKGTYESNERHRTVDEAYPGMPEWYSEWPQRRVSGKQAFNDLMFSIGKHLRDPRLLFQSKRQK